MATLEPGWELYRTFLEVVRERSLSGAARALGLTQPTVGRHVSALEEALGTTLFTRSPAGLLATAGALRLVPHAEAMASAAHALRRVASGDEEEERGAVRVTASEMIGTEVLPGAFAELRELHPQIDVQLVLSNRSEDLLRREADIAVRMVKPTQGALLARKVGTLSLGLHAHPRYLQRHGAPRSVEELRQHAFIGFDAHSSVRRLPSLGLELKPELFAFRCDSDVGQYAALKAGFGVGVCQVALAKRDGLVPITLRDGALKFELGVWIAMHKDLKGTRRMRVMFEHLARALTRHVALEKS
jgi:DNA-binding transcriptional LysR family regulator